MRAPAYARGIVLALLIAPITLVAFVLFGGGGSDYTVTARFINAGQIVKGNPAQAGGVPIGSVESIELTPGGQADLTLSFDAEHSPLPTGTRAAIRQLSQSSCFTSGPNLYDGTFFPIPRSGKAPVLKQLGPLDGFPPATEDRPQGPR